MAELLTTPLPTVADVGSNVYHRAYNARKRANLLLQRAEEQQVDVSMLRHPTSWTELPLFVKSLKALVRSARDTERLRLAFLAKKAWRDRPVLQGTGAEAYAELIGQPATAE